ncbi:hypothetical protein PIIN_02705 [Serendipita indica DSM 11827]|uniref:Uncharacterized protein n=1 Tax=Serendipita indica (strain DSM 11827) TaxID=1109443 RepID=G4TC11_SERID|nr:hypothetical protein PIIN_02705 [Serendipita indica DSM 11827]
MTEEESRIPPLTYYCYQSVYAHIDRLSSLGRLPYKLIKPVLFAVDADTLKHLEQGYDDWQRNEYLDPTDGPEAVSLYASASRSVPVSWRDEYFALTTERQNAVSRASDRVSRFRVAQETDQRKAKLVHDLPPTRRRGNNPLHSIINPAFRKVVADTRKMSIAAPNQQAVHKPYPMPNFRPPSTMPIRTEPTHQSRSKGSPHPRSSQSTLFIPKSRP